MIAKKTVTGSKELLQIECKRYEHRAGPQLARELLGVVSDERATKGVLVAMAGFTRGARDLAKRNSRLELIDGPSLVRLLNEHLGPEWVVRFDRLLSEAEGKPFGRSQAKR